MRNLTTCLLLVGLFGAAVSLGQDDAPPPDESADQADPPAGTDSEAEEREDDTDRADDFNVDELVPAEEQLIFPVDI